MEPFRLKTSRVTHGFRREVGSLRTEDLWNRALFWMTAVISLLLFASCTSESDNPYPNYLNEYPTFLGECVARLESQYGVASGSSQKRAAMVTVCDAEFFDARPGLREWLDG
jgi:hypothetical protein